MTTTVHQFLALNDNSEESPTNQQLEEGSIPGTNECKITKNGKF